MGSGSAGVFKPPMCALAKRVPKPKSSNNHLVDSVANFEYTAFVGVINYLTLAPNLRRDTFDFVQTAYENSIRVKQCGDDFDDSEHIDQYDEEWKAAFISSKVGFSMRELGIAKSKDPKVIKHIFRALLNCSPQLKLPPECGDRAVMDVACTMRIADMGNNRPALLKDPTPVIDSKGDVDWRAGIYESIKDEESGRVIGVRHRPTGHLATIDQRMEYNINSTFYIRNNFDDSGAEFYKSKNLRYNCASFFGEAQGPNVWKAMKGNDPVWKSIVSRAHDTVQARKATASMVKAEKQQYYTPIKQAQSAGTKRAREELAKRAEESDKKRRARI